MKKIRVLVVDDSALVRKLLTEIINSSEEMEVIDTAADPFIARDKIKALRPDVLTLDVEMPRMDGLTFLDNLMRLRPMPVVMISTLTEKGAEVTLNALRLGAVDFIAKPKIDVSHGLNDYAEEIHAKIKIASKSRNFGRAARHVDAVAANGTTGMSVASDNKLACGRQKINTTDKIIGIGASTGGTEAIKDVLCELPANMPAIVISQHLPASFSKSFARHVSDISQMKVCIAEDNQAILPGNVYIAPGDKHLLIRRNGARYVAVLDDGAPVNRHKPSVDVMFSSMAKNVGANAICVLLTGMGADGAKGMQEMHNAGASTIIQDEATSVVWGMPGEAYRLGCTDQVLPLSKVGQSILAKMN